MTRSKYRELKDAALLRAVLAKDAGAWREFVRRFEKPMRRCVRGVGDRYRNVRASDDVDDIMSEVFVGFLADDMQKLRAFDATRGRRLSSWVSLLAIKMAHDYYRNLRRSAEHVDLDEAVDVADPAPDALEQLIDVEERDRLGQLLAILPANDREFMECCLDDDANIHALASRFAVSPETIRGRRARIVTQIRSRAMKEGAA